AQMLETLMGVDANAGSRPVRTGPRQDALRRARVCYDHLAGELGVLVYERLALRGAFALGAGGMALTPDGAAILAALGVDIQPPAGSRRPLCRTCLGRSEPSDHLAGVLGSALFGRSGARG